MVALLASHEFKALLQHLGWDRASATSAVNVNGHELSFHAIAQKRGLVVLHCNVDRTVLADRTLLRAALTQSAKNFHEQIAICSCEEPRKQVWLWAVRMPDGRRFRHREHPFFSADPPPSFLTRLEELAFTLQNEEDATILKALDRVRCALDVDAERSLFARRPNMAKASDRLARLIQTGDEAAFHRFVLMHRPLARRLSRRLQRWFSKDLDDAEQTAYIGLILAAKKFKPELGYQLSTYASHWIKQACQRYGPDFAHPINIPQHVFWPCFRLQLQLARERAEWNALPSLSEEDRVRGDAMLTKSWRNFRRATRLRRLPSSGALVEQSDPPAEVMMRKEDWSTLRQYLEKLRDRDAQILKLRYGIDVPVHTLEEVGKELGLTRERVRQIQERAEAHLLALLKKDWSWPEIHSRRLARKG